MLDSCGEGGNDQSLKPRLELPQGFTYVGHNIMGGSWLSKGMVSGLPTINNTALTSLSQRVNRSVLLICVRWALQRGLAVTVSMDEVRLEEIPLLLEVFAFELADREMAVVDALEYTLPENSVRKEMGKEVHGDPKREEQPKRVRDGGGGAARDIPARAAKDRGPPAQEGGQQQQQERRPGKPPRGSTHATKQ